MIRACRRILLTAVPLALLIGALAVVAPAEAADTGSISGTVTARPAGGAAAPYANATVYADRLHDEGPDDNAIGQATPDASGHFTVTGLPDGTYRLRTYPFQYGALGQYGYEYYDNKWGPYANTEIQVNGGAVSLAKAIELRPIGHVVGTVRDEQGKPMVGAYVNIGQADSGSYSTVTDANGHYDSLDGQWTGNLIPGDYSVEASSSSYGIDDPQYYYDTHAVTVTPGGVTTQDITMRERPRVLFTVLDTDGEPLADAPVNFQVRTGGGAWGPPQYGPNETDAQGRYRFVDNFDDFKIQFGLPNGYAGDAVPEYWDDAYSFADAKVLSFPTGVAKSRRFTVQLEAAPSITPGTPVISGTALAGNRLTADAGGWAPNGVQLAYQWLSNGAPIAGATSRTYLLTDDVVGTRVSVRVTGSLDGAEGVTTESAPTTAVIGLLSAHRATIKGTLRKGKKVTARVAAWGPGPVKLSYAWLRGSTPIKGASGPTYQLAKADVGSRIKVVVTGRKDDYRTASTTSAQTGKVRN